MSRCFNRFVAFMLTPLIAAGTVITVSAQTVESEADAYNEPQCAAVTQSGETEKFKLDSEVLYETPDEYYQGKLVQPSGDGDNSATDQNGNIGDLTWSFDASSKTLTVSGEGELIRDTDIDNQWKSMEIDKLVVEDGVTAVGNQSFVRMSVKEISLPDTLTTIDYHAFGGCEYLESISIPDSVTDLGKGAFAYCSSLNSVKLPSKIESIKDDTFYDCTSLKSITLPKSVTSIGESAFKNCTDLSEVNILGDVTVIGDAAFNYCTSLESITLPDSVTTIDGWAFCNSAIKSIDLPDSVTKMGNGAFSYCNNLTEFVFPPDLTVIPEETLGYCHNLTSVTIPEGVTKIGRIAFVETGLESIQLPSTLTSIADTAFADCKNLTSIVIPDSVTDIEYQMFRGCTSLKGVKLSDSLTKISDSMFAGCESLEQIYIGDSVTQIADNAFLNHSDNLTILCTPGSYAHEYALTNNIKYDLSADYLNGVITIKVPDECVGQLVRVSDTNSERVFCTRFIDNKNILIYGLNPNFSYKAEILSYRGTVLASEDNIILNNYYAGIDFKEIKPRCSVEVSVRGVSGADLTDSCKIQWFTESGEYIDKGDTLNDAVMGESFKYTVSFMYKVLEENYFIPAEQTVTVDDVKTKSVIELEAIPDVVFTGIALNEDGRSIEGASVSLTQKIGKNIEKTLTTVTGEDGRFSLAAKDVPSSLIIKKTGHETYSKDFENLSSDELNVTMNKVNYIGVDLNFTKKELDHDNYIAMSGDFDLTVINKSTGKEVKEFYISNLQLMLPSNEVGKNDIIEVTAVCGDSEEQSRVITLGEDTAVSMEFIPYGKLLIVQKNTDNKDNTAILFSETDGCSVTALNLKKQQVLSEGLPDGDYTVIMMNKSGRYSAPRTPDDFDKYGLEENKDYIKTSVKIERGKTTKLEDVVIPDMDEDKASIFKRSSTYVRVNKSSVTIGQYAVVYVDYLLKDNIVTDDLALELSVPSNNLKPAHSSVTVDGKSVYLNVIDSDTIHIPLKKNSGYVIIALKTVEAADDCVITAGLSYTNNGETINETIDSVNVSVKESFFYLPTLVADTTVHSFGTTIPDKKVEYYDNGTLAGTTYSNASGDYNISFELIEPHNRSYHKIYIAVDTGEGVIKSGIRELEYNRDAIVIEKVNMYDARKPESLMTVNFLSPEENTLNYSFNPNYPKLSFEVFVQGDISKVTYAAVLTTSSTGETTRVPLTYDETRGTLIGSYNYTTDTRPAEISVDFSAEQEEIVDYDEAYADADKLYKLMDEYNAAAEEMNKAAEELEEASAITKDEMISYLKDYGFTDETIALLDLDDLLETANNDLADNIKQICDDGEEACSEEIGELDKCFEELNGLFEDHTAASNIYAIDESVTAQQLLDEGYIQIKTYDNKGLLFEKGNDKNQYDFIDLTRRYAMVYPENNNSGKLPNISGACADCDHNIIPLATIADITMDISKSVKPAAKQLSTMLKWIENFQKTQLGFLNSVSDTFNIEVPKDLGDPANISNPQLRKLAEKVVGNIALNKYIGKAMKFNAAIQAVLAPLQAVCEAIIALSDLGDICSMIERLAPQLCSCTVYSNHRVEWAINDLYFQLGAIATDVTACSIPGFNSMYDLAKTGLRGAVKGLGKLKIIDEETVKSCTDPFAYGRQTTRNGLLNASRFLSDCKCDNDKDKKNEVKIRSAVDPSGFICEAVESNRIQGVTATLWYSENKNGTNAVVWDAEEWSQENPLISDDNGHYEWYVPEGWWQVKFEKDGYETAYSEWVPVLPIQTEINVSMKSLYAPEVTKVTAYKDFVDITFSQYMNINSLTEDNVRVYSGDTLITGKLEPTNAETSFDNDRIRYASKFRFIPDTALSGSVTVKVDKVRSYNGLYINSEYTANAMIVEKIEKIDAPKRLVVKYNEPTVIEIQLLPEKAAANVEVTISAVESDMFEISSNTVMTDSSGKAAVTLTGKLPTQAELTFTASDFDISAVTNVILSEDPDKEPAYDEPEVIGLLGDVDKDGKISAKDSMLVQRYVINLKNLDETQFIAADVNADGKVTNKDALEILRYTIHMSKNDKIGQILYSE